MHQLEVDVGFTYYGDLLGISGYYRLSPEMAKEKLNEFYDTVFCALSNYCEQNPRFKVHMFSDSLLIYGDDAKEGLKQIHYAYINLLHKNILLRGAAVNGYLNFQIRTELKNFEKQLPEDDTLARAIGLEKAKKGARFLIEPALARDLLQGHPEWLLNEGYITKQLDYPYNQVPIDDPIRRIAPTPEQDGYEFLYFWVCHPDINHDETDYNKRIKILTDIKAMLSDRISDQHAETIALLKRCKAREKVTLLARGMER